MKDPLDDARELIAHSESHSGQAIALALIDIAESLREIRERPRLGERALALVEQQHNESLREE
jgi:hypothetical protein